MTANDMDKVTLAFDLLEDADVIRCEPDEDEMWIRVSKSMWNELWGNDDDSQ